MMRDISSRRLTTGTAGMNDGLSVARSRHNSTASVYNSTFALSFLPLYLRSRVRSVTEVLDKTTEDKQEEQTERHNIRKGLTVLLIFMVGVVFRFCRDNKRMLVAAGCLPIATTKTLVWKNSLEGAFFSLNVIVMWLCHRSTRPRLRLYLSLVVFWYLFILASGLPPFSPACHRYLEILKYNWEHSCPAEDEAVFCALRNLNCTLQGHTFMQGAMTWILLSFRIVPYHHLMIWNWAYISLYVAASIAWKRMGEDVYRFSEIFFCVGFLSISHFIAMAKKYYVDKSERIKFVDHHKQEKATKQLFELLRGMVPVHVIQPVMLDPSKNLAEPVELVSILFIVILDFDKKAQQLSPEKLLKFLNETFQVWDVICKDRRVTKIETVREEYVCAVGVVPMDIAVNRDAGHQVLLERLVKAATEILSRQSSEVKLKMGLHTGPISAGVIGQKLPRFRLFGDTINTAARFMQKGEEGRLQFGEATRKLLPEWVKFTTRPEPIELKGKGKVTAHLLECAEVAGGDTVRETSLEEEADKVDARRKQIRRRASFLDLIAQHRSSGSDASIDGRSEAGDSRACSSVVRVSSKCRRSLLEGLGTRPRSVSEGQHGSLPADAVAVELTRFSLNRGVRRSSQSYVDPFKDDDGCEGSMSVAQSLRGRICSEGCRPLQPKPLPALRRRHDSQGKGIDRGSVDFAGSDDATTVRAHSDTSSPLRARRPSQRRLRFLDEDEVVEPTPTDERVAAAVASSSSDSGEDMDKKYSEAFETFSNMVPTETAEDCPDEDEHEEFAKVVKALAKARDGHHPGWRKWVSGLLRTNFFTDDLEDEWFRWHHQTRLCHKMRARLDRQSTMFAILTAWDVFYFVLNFHWFRLKWNPHKLYGDVEWCRLPVFLLCRLTCFLLLSFWQHQTREDFRRPQGTIFSVVSATWLPREPYRVQRWLLACDCLLAVLTFISYDAVSNVSPNWLDPLRNSTANLESVAEQRFPRQTKDTSINSLLFFLVFHMISTNHPFTFHHSIVFFVLAFLLMRLTRLHMWVSPEDGHSIFTLFWSTSGEANFLALSAFSVLSAYELEGRSRSQFKATKNLNKAQNNINALVDKLIPPLIAEEFRDAGPRVSPPSHHYKRATVVQSDLCGFTQLASEKSPQEVVKFMSDLFGRFDKHADERCVWKVETVGDAYIAGQAEAPLTLVCSAVSVVLFGYDMVRAVDAWADGLGVSVRCRVGVHHGHCVGGIVGWESQRYHLFGDLMSVVEVLESTSQERRVQVSVACRDEIERQIREDGPVDGELEILGFEQRREPHLETSKGEIHHYEEVGGQTFFVNFRTPLSAPAPAPALVPASAGTSAAAGARAGAGAGAGATP